jgi:hypothetical protein
MKQYLLLLLFFCFFTNLVFSQQTKRFKYLIVQIQSRYDEFQRPFFKIVPEAGNPNASSINTLIKFSGKLLEKKAAYMYGEKYQTGSAMFNYFTSISLALQFLDEQGWQLFTINNDIQSDFPHDRVKTDVTYYLRKESN